MSVENELSAEPKTIEGVRPRSDKSIYHDLSILLYGKEYSDLWAKTALELLI